MAEQMNEHRCEKCEHEKECLNMVCFYELLEKEEGKIRADERAKVLDECYAEIKDLIDVVCKGDTRPHFAWDVVYRELWVGLDKRFKKLKEQKNE